MFVPELFVVKDNGIEFGIHIVAQMTQWCGCFTAKRSQLQSHFQSPD